MKKRILAIDYGTKRLGVAVSSPLDSTVFPLPYLKQGTWDNIISHIEILLSEKNIQQIVVGLPKSLDGSLGSMAKQCQQFAGTLKKNISVPITLFDERFTSKEAESILIEELNLSRKKRKELKDSLSACLLLQSYLRSIPGERV